MVQVASHKNTRWIENKNEDHVVGEQKLKIKEQRKNNTTVELSFLWTYKNFTLETTKYRVQHHSITACTDG